MSYFPSDIPYMSEKELLENRIKIPKIEPYLKPCPFCGGRAVLRSMNSNTFCKKYYVSCYGGNNCELNVVTFNKNTPEAAVKAWNRREGGKE